MPEDLTLDRLKNAVTGNAAALRCRRRLRPAGGDGDKVFPPTFAGAVYAVEQRRVPGRDQPVTCVLLDSVQSQANRMEEALQDAVDAGRISIPLIAVDFSASDPTGDVEQDRQAGRLIDAVGAVTSLQAPHRLADAILRDSEHEGMAFRDSEVGLPLKTAVQRDPPACPVPDGAGLRHAGLDRPQGRPRIRVRARGPTPASYQPSRSAGRVAHQAGRAGQLGRRVAAHWRWRPR